MNNMSKQYRISYIAESPDKYMTTTDYESAREACWKELCDGHRKYGETTRNAFDFAFESAYRFGRWSAMEEARAQPVNNSDKFGNSEELRAQVAIAAMQGILSCNNIQNAKELALGSVIYADALLAELDKTNHK